MLAGLLGRDKPLLQSSFCIDTSRERESAESQGSRGRGEEVKGLEGFWRMGRREKGEGQKDRKGGGRQT